MRKIIILLILCITLPFAAAAQQITASPFEGFWVWDEKGDEDLIDITELIFFGNVLICYDTFYEFYYAYEFTYTGQVIEFSDYFFDEVWQYKLSGNTLVIIDEDDYIFSYIKRNPAKNPLEGFWKAIESSFDDFSDYDLFLIFIDNLFVINEDGYLDVFDVDFFDGKFYAGMEYLDYNVNGDILTLFDSDDSNEYIILKKVY